MGRLHPNILKQLPENLQLPTYDRDKTNIGIVHFGIGAFHRCHQALYTEAVLNQYGGNWGICGVSLRSETVSRQLNPQQGLYTCTISSHKQKAIQVVGAVKKVLVASQDNTQIINQLNAIDTHVVTLTITEKGYYLDPASGRLDTENIDIQHDLQTLSDPRTIYGFLYQTFLNRHQQQLPGLTVISCDNLSDNGKKLQTACETFIRQKNKQLWSWVGTHVCFPNTMVDRIVPATKAEEKAFIEQQLGVTDEACVVTEAFSQWVIENNFATAIPPWENAGAQLVDNIAPFETMKLRLLNASHSTMAYIGCLVGLSTVADVIENNTIRNFIIELMRTELAPTLEIPTGFDLDNYQQDLIARFANRGLQHLTRQIAMDGSQKIPQRLLPALRFHLQHGSQCRGLTLALAIWLRYLRGIDEQKQYYEIDDPLQQTFVAIAQSNLDSIDRYIHDILAIEAVFSDDLGSNTGFVTELIHYSEQLKQHGVINTLESHEATD